MPEETKTVDKNKETQDQIKNFLMFQKLMGEQIKQKISLDPYMKGASGALKKLGEKEVTESALQIGADKTAQQLNQMVMGNTTSQGVQTEGGQQGASMLSQLMGQQSSQQQTEQQQFNPVKILEQIISLGGLIQPNPSDAYLKSQTALNQQKLAGQEPLQKGKKEEIGLETQKAILTEIAKMDKEGRLKPNDLFSGYENASKSFILSRDAHSRVEASAKDPSAAGDLAMIFNFMKVLDPGSTVREGEFANAQNSVGVPQQIRNTYNRVISGKKLGTEQRADFLNRSRKLFKAAEDQQSKTTSEFHTIAKKNGLDPNKIFRDVGLEQTQPGTQSVTTTPSGNKYRRK